MGEAPPLFASVTERFLTLQLSPLRPNVGSFFLAVAFGAIVRMKVTAAARARCAVCGAIYDQTAWSILPITEELSPSQVRAHVAGPIDWSIEVRLCHCGSRLARRSTRSGE